MSDGRPRARSCVLPFLLGGASTPPATLVVSAHPDDEVIGLGGQLAALGPRLHLVEVTDGAPRDMRDARAHGFATREDYAAARRRELLRALAEAGIAEERVASLELVDQEASLQLVTLAGRLRDVFEALRPEAVFAPAYEGGHPDHDAVAFATWAARALCRRAGADAPEIHEFPLYHAGPAGRVSGEFVADGRAAFTLTLGPAALARKRRMVACFASQREVLAGFPLATESFRPQPDHDFARPPHSGALHYEAFEWGMDGARWRRLAGAALAELGLGRAPEAHA